MATNKVIIDVKEKGSKKASSALGKLKGALKEVATPAAALGVAYFGSKMLLQGMKESIKLAGEQEAAEKKLETAMGNNAQGLKDYAAELQKTTTFGDEMTIEAMALMGAFTQNEDELKALTKATMDYAAATGTDLKSAASLVGRSFGTSMNAMSRYGVEVEGAAGSTERLESLTNNLGKMFGGQAAAAADTMKGRLEQMSNAIGDAQEVLGGMMAPLVKWGATMVTTAAEGIGAFLENIQKIDVGPTFENIFSDLDGWITLGVDILKIWWNSLPVIIKNAWEDAKKIFSAAFEFVYGADGLFFTMIDKVKDLAGFLWEPLPIAFNIGIKKIEIFFTEMWVTLQNLGIAGVNKLIPMANKVAELLGFDTIPLLAETNMKASTQILENELGDLQENLANTGMGSLVSDIFTITEEDAESVSGMLTQMKDKIAEHLNERIVLKQEADIKESESEEEKQKRIAQANIDANKEIVDDKKKTEQTIQTLNAGTFSNYLSGLSSNVTAMADAGVTGKREAKALAKMSAFVSTIDAAQKAYAAMAGIPVVGPALGAAAASAALIAGMARVAQIESAQEGYSGVVDKPTMFLAGENGAENVNITNLDVPGGGMNSATQPITVNVSGNVMTSDFVETTLADSIRDAIRRNVSPYNEISFQGR